MIWDWIDRLTRRHLSDLIDRAEDHAREAARNRPRIDHIRATATDRLTVNHLGRSVAYAFERRSHP